MKFRPDTRRNPFDNWVVALVAHAAAQVGMAVAIYWSLMERSWVPVAAAFVAVMGVEGLWLYYRLRR
jgi:CHASE2 domain-containing sensor protein